VSEVGARGEAGGEVGVEVAGPDDAEAIAALLARNRAEPTLLLQPVERVRAHIDEFVLVRAGAGIHACAQLRRHRPDIAEIMSVAVDPAEHGRGLGSACVRALLRQAQQDAVALVWLATTQPEFFAKLGFEVTPMTSVPWSILLGKLSAVLRQPPRRWPAALLGGQVFMRLVGEHAHATRSEDA
jgi:amino-acid N-acetyltransferase